MEGFYKNDNGQLLNAPNKVENKEFSIIKENRNEYNYPVNGWHWFDSEEEARQILEIPIVKETSLDE